MDKTSRDSVILSLNGGVSPPGNKAGQKVPKINMNDYADVFFYEPIGIGPTYTIASFNCDNLLAGVKNRTKVMGSGSGGKNSSATMQLKSGAQQANGTRKLLARDKPNKEKEVVFRNSQKDVDKSYDDFDEYYNYDDDETGPILDL